MYLVEKVFEISAAHCLKLDYESKCQRFHGHNWKIKVCCKSDALDENGMVYDFTKIKTEIQDLLDHVLLNDILKVNPTAENIAHWICMKIGYMCWKVEVQESEGNTAIYCRDI